MKNDFVNNFNAKINFGIQYNYGLDRSIQY